MLRIVEQDLVGTVVSHFATGNEYVIESLSILNSSTIVKEVIDGILIINYRRKDGGNLESRPYEDFFSKNTGGIPKFLLIGKSKGETK